MQLNHFGYELPEDLIAQHPLKKRDSARLMVVDRKHGRIIHEVFANINGYLPPQSEIVLNDSKVIPARLLGRKEFTGAKVEIFLLKQLEDGYSYQTLIRPLRRVRNGGRIIFDANCDLIATILDWEKRLVRFNKRNVLGYLEKIGHIPLPPYIRRADNKEDRKYYQTVFAKNNGSVASPTAGLHFTEALLRKLKTSGHKIEKVTLHINYATFKPVEEPDITRHKMHLEEYSVNQSVYRRIIAAKKESRKIVAVGTTSCRVLETLASNKGLKGETNIFIYPGYEFKMVDALLTNFHLPFSTLLMLVYAFGGQDLMKKAYAEAIKEKYRFYSYGDCMLIV